MHWWRFLNLASGMLCAVCDFVAKNVKRLQIHKWGKHTATRNCKCDLCNFKTNNKSFFQHNCIWPRMWRKNLKQKIKKLIIWQPNIPNQINKISMIFKHQTRSFPITTQNPNVPGYSYLTLVVGKVLIM